MDIGIVIDIFVVDGGWLLGLGGWSEVLIPGGSREEATLGQVERRAFVATQVPISFLYSCASCAASARRCVLQCTHGEQFGECALV